MNNYPSKFFRLMTILALIYLLFSSIVFANGIKPLKRDRISPKEQSIVFGRLRIPIDKKTGFNPIGKRCRLNLWNFYSDEKLPEFIIKIKSEYRFKSSSDETEGYDIPFFAKIESGRYIFGGFNYEFQNYPLSDISNTTNFIDNGYLTSVYLRIHKECMIPIKSLVYLGVIQVDIFDIYFKGSDTIINSYCRIIDNDYEKDLNNFQSLYPNIYEQFKDNIVSAEWYNLKIQHIIRIRRKYNYF